MKGVASRKEQQTAISDFGFPHGFLIDCSKELSLHALVQRTLIIRRLDFKPF